MAPIMQLLRRDGLLNIVKKDLHNLKLMYKGHQHNPHQDQHHHRHLTPGGSNPSRQHEMVLIVDDFLTPEEIKLASDQTYKLQAERSVTDNLLIATKWKTQAEQQFIIDMPATIADRLRDVVDKHLGIDAAATTGKRGDAPKQERLPARVIYGITEEHIDEPKDAAPGGEISQGQSHNEADDDDDPAVKLKAQTTKDAYRQGMIAVVYLEGDGALVLGTGDAAREVPVKPGRLVAWPNTDFIHSAYGEERRLLGPLAVIPGDRTAPLWLTVKGAGALVILFPMALGLVAFAFAQVIVGSVFSDQETSCRPWPDTAFGITDFLQLSGLFKLFGIVFPVIITGCFREESHKKSLGQLAFYNCFIQSAIIVFGAVVTYSTSPSDCNEGLYQFTSVTIGMALVTMAFIFALIGKWKIDEIKNTSKKLLEHRIKRDFQGKWEIHEEEVENNPNARNDYAGYLNMKHELRGTDVQLQERDGKVLTGMGLDQETRLEYVVEYRKESNLLVLSSMWGMQWISRHANKHEIKWIRMYKEDYKAYQEHLGLSDSLITQVTTQSAPELRTFTWKRATGTATSAKEAEEAQTLLRVRELREEADLLEASLNDIELVEALA